MKNIKKFTTLLVICTLVLNISLCFADGNKSTQEVQKYKVEQQLKQIAKKHNINLVNLDTTKVGKTLKFHSLEEFDKFLKVFKDQNNTNVILTDHTRQSVKRVISGTDSHLYQQWVPFSAWGLAGLTTTRNISFTYDYYDRNGEITYSRIYDIDSWLSGIDFIYWSPRNTTSKLSSDKKTANIKIIGEVICGVEVVIDGVKVPVGASVTETWTCCHTLN